MISQLGRSTSVAYTTSIFVLMDPGTMAEHFCLIEMEYFKSVGWFELLAYIFHSGRGLDPRTHPSYPEQFQGYHNLQLMITRFNQLCWWLGQEIQMARSLEDQARIISALIHIAAVMPTTLVLLPPSPPPFLLQFSFVEVPHQFQL